MAVKQYELQRKHQNKTPAILHLCKLGHSYLSLSKTKQDESMNSFMDIFAKSILRSYSRYILVLLSVINDSAQMVELFGQLPKLKFE